MRTRARPAEKHVLLVGVSEEDCEPLKRLANAATCQFHAVGSYDEASDPLLCRPRQFIAEALRWLKKSALKPDAVMGADDYPQSILVPALARRLNLPGTPLAGVYRAENKAWSRAIQKAVVPRASPRFAVLDPKIGLEYQDCAVPFPLWVKPVKSFMSYLGFRARRPAELGAALAEMRERLPPFVAAFDALQPAEAAPPGYAGIGGGHALAEALIGGHQCCLDGFVWQGEVTALGIVDSIRTSNRVSFSRFQYPSRLPERFQRRIIDVTRRIVPAIGLDNTLFNIEFFVDPRSGRPTIIEINSRFSPQFADIYEKVDGTSTLALVLDAALGIKPSWSPGQGRYRMAASFVLRCARDRQIIRIPSESDIARVGRVFPGTVVKLRAAPGKRLSEWPQDSFTFRYAMVHIGADSSRELKMRLEKCRRMLPFAFAR